MASIDKNKLISKLGYVAYFNEKVWGQINSTAGGNIYHAGADITLNKDKITNVTADEEGRYIKTGETPISIKRMPKFSSTGYTGGNTTSGKVAFSNMNAIRPEHLKTLNANDRQMFTIYDTDIPSKVIIADELYACCFNVIRKLISIRPFTASWQHDSSVANKKINEKFNEVNALEKDLASAKALNQQLNANIESKTDLGYIEKYAKYQLGMQKPNESQIVRIAYEKRDKISTPIIIDEEEDSSFFSRLFNDLRNLID